MSARGPLPSVPPEALRDHAERERVDGLWERIAADTAPRVRRPGPRWSAWAPVAAASLAAVFGAGVWVGKASVEVAPFVHAEQSRPAQEGPRRAEVVVPPQEALAPEPTSAPPLRVGPPRVVPPSPIVHAPPPPSAVAPLVAAPPTAAARPEWVRLADDGDYRAAREVLLRAGGPDPVLRSGSAEQLLLLHDVARGTGDAALAMQALRRVVERFPRSESASVAWYALAGLLEKQGDRAGAERAYAEVRRLSPRGDFAEDALVRELEAAIARGDVERARALGEQHASDFPNGRRRGEVQAKLARLAGEGSDAGAAPVPEEDEEPASTEPSPVSP